MQLFDKILLWRVDLRQIGDGAATLASDSVQGRARLHGSARGCLVAVFKIILYWPVLLLAVACCCYVIQNIVGNSIQIDVDV